jgi:hypothetical protein
VKMHQDKRLAVAINCDWITVFNLPSAIFNVQ